MTWTCPNCATRRAEPACDCGTPMSLDAPPGFGCAWLCVVSNAGRRDAPEAWFDPATLATSVVRWDAQAKERSVWYLDQHTTRQWLLTPDDLEANTASAATGLAIYGCDGLLIDAGDGSPRHVARYRRANGGKKPLNAHDVVNHIEQIYDDVGRQRGLPSALVAGPDQHEVLERLSAFGPAKRFETPEDATLWLGTTCTQKPSSAPPSRTFRDPEAPPRVQATDIGGSYGRTWLCKGHVAAAQPRRSSPALVRLWRNLIGSETPWVAPARETLRYAKIVASRGIDVAETDVPPNTGLHLPKPFFREEECTFVYSDVNNDDGRATLPEVVCLGDNWARAQARLVELVERVARGTCNVAGIVANGASDASLTRWMSRLFPSAPVSQDLPHAARRWLASVEHTNNRPTTEPPEDGAPSND